jgi:pantoate--beta-alanine ligase
MKVARRLPELHAACAEFRASHGAVALVPTMGALHAGHMALVERALAGGAGTVASVFVNPLQFGANEDLARYPRDEAADLAKLEAGGCHVAWLPDVPTMYPPGGATEVEVGGPARHWEGTIRPGHFRGVATVCTKLFGQTAADLAFFGEKDWQQLQVISRVVLDLHQPTRIVGVPTVREPDGLALSSRNRFLSASERALAPLLFALLHKLAETLGTGAPAAKPLDEARRALEAAGLRPDYVALVDGLTLDPLEVARAPARLIAAARLGSVRLLDNVAVG